jgi:hypothetical protein
VGVKVVMKWKIHLLQLIQPTRVLIHLWTLVLTNLDSTLYITIWDVSIYNSMQILSCIIISVVEKSN